MSGRSKAQRAAEARYEVKRKGVAVTLRLSCEQGEWLDARRKPDESRPAAMRRLAKMPTCRPTPKFSGARSASAGMQSWTAYHKTCEKSR